MEKRIAKEDWADRIIELELQNKLLRSQVEVLTVDKLNLDHLASNYQFGVIIADQNYAITLCNHHFFDIFKISNSNQLIGKNICDAFELVSEQFHYKERYLIRLRSIIYGSTPISSNKLELTDHRILDLKFIPVMNNNNIISTIITIRDITELYNQKHNRSTDKIWQCAIEGSNEGVWDWDLTNNKVYFSPQWKKMLGFEENEIKNDVNEWKSRVHPTDLEGTLKKVENHIKGETEFYKSEHRIKCKNNTYKWILDRGKVVSYDKNGAPLRMVGTHSDITERKVAEEKLKVVNNQLTQERQLFMLGNVLIFKINNRPNLPIEYVSPNIKSMLGYTEKEVYNTSFSFSDIIHKDDIDKRFGEDSMSNNDQQGSSFNNEPYRLIRKNGEVIWVHEYTQIIRHKNGSVRDYIGYLVDVTDMIDTRLELINNQKLQEQLIETKDKILSIIAHDLKGSFNSLIGFSDIILDNIKEKDFKNVERFSRIIHNTSNKTYLLFVNLLNWIKKQSQKIELNPQPLQSDLVVSEALDASKHLAHEKQVKLSSVASKTIKFTADRNMMNTILRNLISNAIKFVEQGGVVNVDVKQNETNTEFRVTDNGVGIPPENLSRLFNEKDGVSTLGTNYEKGTGLGLIICKEFVKQHGGKIWVTSEENIATTFTFSIPKTSEGEGEKEKEPNIRIQETCQTRR